MKRSKFNLSHTKLLSHDMGELIPIGCIDVLPGDSFKMKTSALIRALALLSPVMHPVRCRIHHWFVPHRLVWDNFENFITGGPDGLNASVFPTITQNVAVGSVLDYLGVPTGTSIAFSALPMRSYNLIWNEFYRDQDLQTAVANVTTDGADATSSTALLNACWEKDYLTSSRPWEVKGPAVSIPLTGNAPIKGIGISGTPPTTAGATFRESTPLPNRAYAFAANGFFNGTNGPSIEMDSSGTGTTKPLIYADLSSVGAVNVNVLRQALAIQRFEEARACYGSRYVEYLRALGVRSSDGRLDRPEYLGGGVDTIQFSEVVATAETGTAVDVGDLKGHGIAAMRSNSYVRFFEEHGYVISCLSVLPKTIYANGLPKHWSRTTKLDFWQRELQHIGQQPVLNKEAYIAHASPNATFGYQDRYDEYRRVESSVHGEFRTTQLDFWHLARIFSSSPALNSTFVSAVPTKRIFAVSTNDVLQTQVRHSIGARRLVAGSGTSFIF